MFDPALSILILLIVGILALIGLASLVHDLYVTRKHRRLISDYLNKLDEYYRSRDDQIFSWLMENEYNLSRALGPAQYMDFKPPYSRIMYKNWTVLNAVPEMRKYHKIDEPEVAGQYYYVLEERLLSRLGFLKQREKDLMIYICMPFYWIKVGIYVIVEAAAKTFGMLRLQTKTLKRAVSILYMAFTVLGAVATLITILNGWQQSWNQFRLLIQAALG